MTLLATADAPTRTPLEIVRIFQERVAVGSTRHEVAAAAAETLATEIPRPRIAIYDREFEAPGLRLLAAMPPDAERMPLGSRVPLEGLLADVLREGRSQRRVNSYINPDFVRSLPGDTRSDLVVPILGREGVGGAIELQYPSPHAPTAAEEALVELVATCLAGYFRPEGQAADDRSEGAAQTAARQIGVLAGVAEQLARSDDVSVALGRVCEGALQLIDAEAAVVLLRHDSRQMLEVAAVAGPLALEVGTLVPREGTLVGHALADGKPHFRDPVEEPEEPFGAPGADLPIRAVLVVPLVAAGTPFGALVAIDPEHGAGTAETVERLQRLALQAAPIEPVRQLATLRQNLSDSSLIAEVGRAITGTLGLDEVLGLVARAAAMLVSARGVAVGLRAEDADRLTMAATDGVLRQYTGDSVPLEGSILGWTVLNGDTATSSCVSDDPRGFPFEPRQGPAAVIPLETGPRIHGALLVTRGEGARPPTDADLDALRKLASYAAIAIDNATLYRRQTQLSERLKLQAHELERAYGELRESQERLVVSEKMAALGRITAGIAHEINSPLGSVLNCVQLARSHAEEYRDSIHDTQVTPVDHEAIAADILETLNLAEGATRKVAEFVRSIKSQTRTAEEEIRAFDPTEEIDSLLVVLQHELRNRSIEVHQELTPNLQIYGDPAKFAVVLQNLLSNAADAHGNEAGEIWLRVRGDEQSVVLEVEDRGCGIPDEIRDRVFDYLFTTKDVGKGTGLGLSMVHSLVTVHFKGTIDLRSQVGEGTTFILTFPHQTETD